MTVATVFPGPSRLGGAQRGDDVRRRGLAAEYAFLARQAARHLIGFPVRHRLDVVDEVVAEQHAGRSVADAIDVVHALGAAGDVPRSSPAPPPRRARLDGAA